MEGDPKFIFSSKFNGRKPGYIFQNGNEGMGYYLDPVQYNSRGRLSKADDDNRKHKKEEKKHHKKEEKSKKEKKDKKDRKKYSKMDHKKGHKEKHSTQFEEYCFRDGDKKKIKESDKISDEDYFSKSTEFRVWLKIVQHK
jgi:hypothetical protein